MENKEFREANEKQGVKELRSPRRLLNRSPLTP
jgi:hypothetical protein